MSMNRFTSVRDKDDTHFSDRKTCSSIFIVPVIAFSCLATVMLFIVSHYQSIRLNNLELKEQQQLYVDFPPLSIKDPRKFGIHEITRTSSGKPGYIFGSRLNRRIPLPTNSWCENILIGVSNSNPSNSISVIPYLVDTAGPILGLRSHPPFIKSNDLSVLLQTEPDSGLTLGAVEINEKTCPDGHVIPDDGGPLVPLLALELEWNSFSSSKVKQSWFKNHHHHLGHSPRMKTAIVRGSPYMSMEYFDATPRIMAIQQVDFIKVDEKYEVQCGTKKAATKFYVNREIEVHFKYNDHTWLLFLSQPMRFTCQNLYGHWPDVSDSFDLRAESPVCHGMVRIAMSNNCTKGYNGINCKNGKPRAANITRAVAQLLRHHADVYPTSPQVSFDLTSEVLVVDWKPARMSDLNREHSHLSLFGRFGIAEKRLEEKELLMFALPHHIELIERYAHRDVNVQPVPVACTPTLQGLACPVLGSIWYLQEALPEVSFRAPRPIREELVEELSNSIVSDLQFDLPLNYRKGAGDTYFSGKMLAKLGRILIIAEELGYTESSDLFQSALNKLRSYTEIWLNGSAKALFLYDASWGGLVNCGCTYNNLQFSCYNEYPNCPALSDPGQNYGNGFFNDHHFHYGYIIYAAAVVVKFDQKWGREFHERIMFLIRDIANPSMKDPYFPVWRHKDWYTGTSWANGIITQGGSPNPNGRNAESSAEAIAAYEAVALYGLASSEMFLPSKNKRQHHHQHLVDEDIKAYNAAILINKVGKLLLSSEVKSVKWYFHVHSPDLRTRRVYPAIYTPKVVGMMWSRLVQQQTWFGNEPWKSYGIQLLTITPASELRDGLDWVREMLPVYNSSCAEDSRCVGEGWSIPILAAEAALCRWRFSADKLLALPSLVFESAGGNGHSLSNSLWWAATRPCPHERSTNLTLHRNLLT